MSRTERLNPVTKIVMKTNPRPPCRATALCSEMGGRPTQQDACQIWENVAVGVTFVVVCDGVGGSRSGADASALVIQTAAQLWNDRGGIFSDPKRDLFSLSSVARNRIADLAAPGEKRAPASTIVALYVTATEAHWIHAGDSRLYHFRNSEVLSRTRDHSVVQILVDQGEVREEDMGNHPDQGRLLQSLGTQEYREPTYGTASVGISDAFLLCTDGFWERTPPRLMASLFQAGPDFDPALRKLVARAVQANGPSGDNVTAAIVAPLVRPAASGSAVAFKKLYPFLLLLIAIMAAAGVGIFRWINVDPVTTVSGGKTTVLEPPFASPVPATPAHASPAPVSPAPATPLPATPAATSPTPTTPVSASPPLKGLSGFPGSNITSPPSVTDPSSPPLQDVSPEMATIDHPFVNSLGMKFVPVEMNGGPASGRRILFSVWDTRVQDYAVFAKETGVRSPEPRFPQELTHPAVNVSWEDAQNYCAWLSKKEGRTYRLPMDTEWSAAVGAGKYPWGDMWPLPKGAGNYDVKLQVRKFPLTSPVGSFAPNACGLYDMGGNVWQWCQDEYKPSMNDPEALEKFPLLRKEKAEDGSSYRVRRGGAWNESDPIILRSSFRDSGHQTGRSIYNGFRCVLVVSSK